MSLSLKYNRIRVASPPQKKKQKSIQYRNFGETQTLVQAPTAVLTPSMDKQILHCLLLLGWGRDEQAHPGWTIGEAGMPGKKDR